MAGPAVKLAPWATGPDSVTPEVGVDGFTALVPIIEPATVGEPPLIPTLCAEISQQWKTRDVGITSGWRKTSSGQTASRLSMPIKWSGLSFGEMETLVEWLRDTLKYTVNAFTYRPDGPGTGTVTVKFTSTPSVTNVTKNVWEVTGQVEEVY